MLRSEVSERWEMKCDPSLTAPLLIGERVVVGRGFSAPTIHVSVARKKETAAENGPHKR